MIDDEDGNVARFLSGVLETNDIGETREGRSLRFVPEKLAETVIAVYMLTYLSFVVLERQD